MNNREGISKDNTKIILIRKDNTIRQGSMRVWGTGSPYNW